MAGAEVDLKQHLLRQMAFSRGTFGPGERREGVSDHIRKELAEVAACPNALEAAGEWVDVVILALEGLIRALQAAGDGPDQAAENAAQMIRLKQSSNECRDWRDWRSADPSKAIEHVRPTP